MNLEQLINNSKMSVHKYQAICSSIGAFFVGFGGALCVGERAQLKQI